MRTSTLPLLLAAALAACTPKASDRAAADAPAPATPDAPAAPAENVSAEELAAGPGAVGEDAATEATNDAVDLVRNADEVDVDAEMPNVSDADLDAEYELEEGDVADPAFDEDAVADGDYVDEVDAMNEVPGEAAATVEEVRDDYADVTARGTLDAAAAAGGLTALGPADAVAAVDRWIVKLEGAGAASAVSAKLRELRGQLTADRLDGPAVGQTLIELGQLTQEASGGGAGELAELGAALLDAGKELTGQ